MRTLDPMLESAAAEGRPGSSVFSMGVAAAAAKARGCGAAAGGRGGSMKSGKPPARALESMPWPFRPTTTPKEATAAEASPRAETPLDAMLTDALLADDDASPPAIKRVAPMAPGTEPCRPTKRPASGGSLSLPPFVGDSPSTVTPPGAESANVLLTVEDAALFPWMTPQEPSLKPAVGAAASWMSRPDATMSDVRGVSVTISGTSAPNGAAAASASAATNAAATVAAVDCGTDGGAGVQVSPERHAVGGGATGRGYPDGVVGGGLGGGAAGASVAGGRWQPQTTTPRAAHSASMVRPGGLSVSVALSGAGISSTVSAGVASMAGVNDTSAGASRRPPSAVSISLESLVAAGAPVSILTMARNAEKYRQCANDAVKATRKLTEVVMEAKSYSDRNNKAAMWRVEAATKLKDKLIMANELISGYSSLRRTAEEDARVAAGEETAAVARLRQAEASQADRMMLEATASRNRNLWGGIPASSPLAFGASPSVASSAGGGIPSFAATTGANVGFTTVPPHVSNGNNGIGNPSPMANGGGGGSGQAFPWDRSAGWYVPRDNTMERRQAVPTPPAGAMSIDGGRSTPLPSGLIASMPLEGSPTSVENRRILAMAATSTARAKEATVVELAKRQKRAEAGRAELVRETQWASDAASKASAAAMHFEQVARRKRVEEKAALDMANHARRKAEQAEWEVRLAVEEMNKDLAHVFSGGAPGERRGGGVGGRRNGEGAGFDWGRPNGGDNVPGHASQQQTMC